MAGSVQPIPEGRFFVVPMLTVHDGAAALEWYGRALGAREVLRMTDRQGKVGFAEFRIGDAPIMLEGECPNYAISAQRLGGSPVTLHLYVDDADTRVNRAVAEGAKLLMPVADQAYGDRSGVFQDPFGHIWMFGTRREDVGHEELQRRFGADFTVS